MSYYVNGKQLYYMNKDRRVNVDDLRPPRVKNLNEDNEYEEVECTGLNNFEHEKAGFAAGKPCPKCKETSATKGTGFPSSATFRRPPHIVIPEAIQKKEPSDPKLIPMKRVITWKFDNLFVGYNPTSKSRNPFKHRKKNANNRKYIQLKSIDLWGVYLSNETFKENTMLEYMTFNLVDDRRISLKLWAYKTNKIQEDKYPTYKILDELSEEKKGRKGRLCPGPDDAEGCPYLNHKAINCFKRLVTKKPTCSVCSNTGREKMFKLSSTLKRGINLKDKNTIIYYRGEFVPAGYKEEKTRRGGYDPAWGGELDEMDHKQTENAIPRSPFDKDAKVKEGHLYFSGNKEEVQQLLDELRANFDRKYELTICHVTV